MIKLYAQAAIYKPANVIDKASFDLPILPVHQLKKTIKINSKHCDQYNNLTEWHIGSRAVVHPNYAQTLSLSMQLAMMVSEPFPFKPMGLVHVANQIQVSFLPQQDAKIQLSTAFGRVYYHRRGWLFEVITRADVAGKRAIKGISYYLARHVHSAEANKYHQNQAKHLPNWIDDLSHTKQVISDVSEQLDFQSNIGRRYAKISGDYNPIHLYPYTAKWLGFNKAIAHGMFSKAWLVSRLAQQHDFSQSAFCLNTVFLQPIMLPLETSLFCEDNNNDGQQNNLLRFSLVSNKRNKKRSHLIGTLTPIEP